MYTEPDVSRENPKIVIEDRVMVPRAALDHEGYRAWVKSDEYPERLRTAFVAGEVFVEMTPESIAASARSAANPPPRASMPRQSTNRRDMAPPTG